MQAKAITRHIRQSPRKIRILLDELRGVNVESALNYLHFSKAKAAYQIEKTLSSALANLMNKIDNKDIELKTLVSEVNSFELSGNREKILVRKGRSYHMIDAGTSKLSDLSKNKIDLSGWKFSIIPREDWKQIFTDAWRMERDYFYDKNMHGVDWDAMHEKYFPLVDRVTTRNELSDLIGRFVGELSALHTSVRGGDLRQDDKDISVASLGAVFSRDQKNKGFKIDYIYKADPDYPNEKSPLDDPYLDVKVGDIITKVNGIDALSAVDIGELVRNESGKQVRITILRGDLHRDIVVKPIALSLIHI